MRDLPDGSPRRSRARHRSDRAASCAATPAATSPATPSWSTAAPSCGRDGRHPGTARRRGRLARSVAAAGRASWRSGPSTGVDALRAEGFRVLFDVELGARGRRPAPGSPQQRCAGPHVQRPAHGVRRRAPRARLAALRAPVGRTVVVPRAARAVRHRGLAGRAVRRGDALGAPGAGKAGLVEQRLVEATTGRSLARAWVVQLLVGADGASRRSPTGSGTRSPRSRARRSPSGTPPAPWGPPP